MTNDRPRLTGQNIDSTAESTMKTPKASTRCSAGDLS